jgi:hypothetical protein
MKPTYKDGRLNIDLPSLLEEMTVDDKNEMVQAMSCDEMLFDHVAEQIINKWTESGYHGGVHCVAIEHPRYGLDSAWRRVAKMSGEVAKREIERLESALLREKEAHIACANELQNLRERVRL